MQELNLATACYNQHQVTLQYELVSNSFAVSKITRMPCANTHSTRSEEGGRVRVEGEGGGGRGRGRGRGAHESSARAAEVRTGARVELGGRVEEGQTTNGRHPQAFLLAVVAVPIHGLACEGALCATLQSNIPAHPRHHHREALREGP